MCISKKKSSKNSFIKAERNDPHRQKRENYQPFFDPRKSTVTKHIKSFPLKESHLSGEKMNYLSAELTMKRKRKLFKEVNPELKVSCTTYWRIFRGNFNYSFGVFKFLFVAYMS